jgi:hypothetical protein
VEDSSGGDASVEDQAAPDVIVDTGSDAPLFAPGDKVLLSSDNPDHLDEDPSVLAAADGSLLIAYFSHRNGNPDLYVRRTTNGVDWTEARVTESPAGDYYPSLSQDSSGTFHITWFRWTAFQVGSIWHTSSTDALSWNVADEAQVTNTPDVDDWIPTLAEAQNGDLVLTFASQKRNPAAQSELYLSRKPAGATSWQAASPITELGSPSEDDTLPIVTRVGDDLDLVWVRCAPGGAPPCLSGSADLWHATSSDDGASWTGAAAITSDAADTTADTLASLYRDHAGAFSVIWISAPAGTNGGAVEAPLASLASPPVPNPAFEGYSPHAAPTPTPGVFLGAWVEQVSSDPNHKDVFYRFFSK